jgi:AraC-type DNA-binding domain-containing proteins
MEREKPYLDPNLSLPELARRSGIARNQLSQALNESLGKSYYDFVNGYRIIEFKRLAADQGRAEDKILSLALDAGFNSKPAFNMIFKKSCGLTPSEFRATTRA